MSDPTQPDAATKQRLLNHMNDSHVHDLRLYLRHLKPSLPASALTSPQLVDISLNHLTIRTDPATTHDLPIDPPMASWADRRTRIIKMSEDAAAALGEPLITDADVSHSSAPRGVVTTWRAPEGTDRIFLFLLLHFYACVPFVFAGYCVPGSPLWIWAETIGAPLQPFLELPVGEWYVWTMKMLLVPTLAIHTVEMWWFDRSRLSVPGKSGIARGTAAWYLWLMSAFLEGYPSMNRFDRVLKEERARAGKKE